MRKIRRGGKKELGIAVIIIAAVLVLMWVVRPNPPQADSVEQVTSVPQARRVLDGVLVEPGKENPPLAGVMVENMVEAQPISGLAEASLVFEALTEANITRFLAYFVLDESGGKASGVPEALPPAIEIGPVRSARPYYLDFAAEFNTIFSHVGSSPAAYELLRKNGVEGVHDLDQWYKREYYIEKSGRPKPHHWYTSTALLRKAYENATPPLSPPYQGGDTVGVWKFKNDAPPDLRGNVNDLRIGYITPYDVKWLYDKSVNSYKRLQWGGVHKAASGQEIMAKNIAVALMSMKVLDEIGRKEFTTRGEGKGLVFQDGRVVVGTWKKSAALERMRFYDGQGVEVEFNAGVSWVEIVPTGYAVKY